MLTPIPTFSVPPITGLSADVFIPDDVTPAELQACITFLKEQGVTPIETPERTVKLARSGMLVFRRKLHKEQGGLCPLCGKDIDLRIKGEGVLDHDHDTGRIRGLLHRSCNAAEGKVANAAGRWGAKSTKYADIVPFLAALVIYLQQPQSRYVYPYHKTPEELILEKRKKDRTRSATARAKARMKKGTA